MTERDIKRDRGMLEFTLKAFKDETVAEEGHDFAATVTGCASLALDYLTLCEHQQRMLEAAIDLIAKAAPCPMPRGHDCARDVSFCEECVRDYLDQRAKEGEKDA